MDTLSTLPDLAAQIARIHDQSQRAAVQQVNTWLTIRNWLIGYYIAEYEQHGADRAAYGEQLLKKLAEALSRNNVSGFSQTVLKLCRQFYHTYPQLASVLWQRLTLMGILPEGPTRISQTPSDQSAASLPGVNPDLLLSRLSFSHFIELLKANTPLQRAFYEVQTVSNGWSVRDLKRAMETSLFERTGLSQDKAAVLAAHTGEQPLTAAQLLR